MLKLIEAFWKICLLQLRPQDLPASGFFVGVSFGLYAITNAIGTAITLKPATAIALTIVHAALLLSLTYAVLWAKELTPRLNQTASALAGSDAILTLIALPVLMWQPEGENIPPIPTLIFLALTIWKLAIVGHILRHAMNIHFLMGVILAVAYMYISINISRMLFIIPTAS